MNGDDFYEEFKNGLKALGVLWGIKHMVKVYIEDCYLVMERGPVKYSIKLKRKK